MDGKELYQRIIDTVQEMHLKIGDSEGSISLYYPFEGDFSGLAEEFETNCTRLPERIVIEHIPGRIRAIIPESVCRYASALPVKTTLRDIVELVNSHCGIAKFRRSITEKYPCASFREFGGIEFDWLLTFPEDADPDVYCINTEMGTVTYHRFSREDYLAMDFEL